MKSKAIISLYHFEFILRLKFLSYVQRMRFWQFSSQDKKLHPDLACVRYGSTMELERDLACLTSRSSQENQFDLYFVFISCCFVDNSPMQSPSRITMHGNPFLKGILVWELHIYNIKLFKYYWSNCWAYFVFVWVFYIPFLKTKVLF